jgi:hypothetical protein
MRDPAIVKTEMLPFPALPGSDHENSITDLPAKMVLQVNDTFVLCNEWSPLTPTVMGNANGALFFTTVSAKRLTESTVIRSKQKLFIMVPPLS